MNKTSPVKIFFAITFIFLVGHFWIGLASINYNFTHYIFGFGAPFLCGYIPYQVFKKLPVNKNFVWNWSIFSAVISVSVASIINEVFWDPKHNNVPFSNAWEHFAIDHIGILSFLLFYFIFLKNEVKNA